MIVLEIIRTVLLYVCYAAIYGFIGFIMLCLIAENVRAVKMGWNELFGTRKK